MLNPCRTPENGPGISRRPRKGTGLVHGAAGGEWSTIPVYRKIHMTDWTQDLAAAAAQAERFEAAESQAEQEFHIVREAAEQAGDAARALQTREFQTWMNARRATDLAWGSWALLKDAS